MKKKYLFLFFLLFMAIKVQALVELDLDEPIIRFEKENDYVLQGFTIVDDNLFTVFIEETEEKPLIKIFNIKNKKLVKELKPNSVGHANDVTYNSKEKKIYIVNGNGKDVVHVFDAISYEQSIVKLPLPIRSMTYIEDKDLYAVRMVSTGFYLNSDLSLKSKFPFVIGMNFSSDVGRQGWAHYDGLLFYSTWSWIRLGGDGTNTIYVYSISGDSLDKIITDSNIGELEDVAFYNDKMILGFNTYDDYIEFYSVDVPKVNRKIVKEQDDEEVIVKKKDFSYLYIIGGGILLLIIICILSKRKKV